MGILRAKTPPYLQVVGEGENFSKLFKNLDWQNVDRIMDHYAPEFRFEDPFVIIKFNPKNPEENRFLLRSYLHIMQRLIKDVEMTIHTELGDENERVLIWTFGYKPKISILNRLRRIEFSGTTHLRMRDGKVVFQRDYYDILGLLLRFPPVFGRRIDSIKEGIANLLTIRTETPSKRDAA